jgi:LuxR family transcriptional regulator, maltose regulon positive regulatory protein
MMGTRAPLVWEDAYTGEARLETGLRLDTPAWVTWLDDPATTSFSYPVDNPARGYIAGFMTVRKERRQRGGAYWTAYWRVGGHLRKAYLGSAATVTTARLRAIGRAWLAQIAPGLDREAAG